MAAARCCLSLLLLSTCVALLLQPLLGARGAPLEPLYPGGNATPEQMAQYAAELHRYINVLTKPRHVPWTWRETPAPGTLGPLHIPGHTLSPAQAPSLAPAPSRPLLGKQSICADQAWAHVPWARECLPADMKQVGWHLGTGLPCIGKKTKRTR
ncbi:PREDICTED: pancreatic prohormone-like [Colobus angolensis palliatus]|uniref:pancreatic prohormone-like n=1 Tax=Colobus angolensis palliatus TaxID=336983 RepID=UPI0005F369B7|nr:PREDICTED: pancreatic prohormone-like [Colobus angolensis palliatus]